MSIHTFHIPVMGLAYTIDTPIKVAHLGIDSVLSIVDDELIEKMNAFYTKKFNLPYTEVTQKMFDYRAQRITNYLNTLDIIVKQKFEAFCSQLSESKQAVNDYLDILPDKSVIKQELAAIVPEGLHNIKIFTEKYLRPGAVDVNIMTKVDKINYDKGMPTPVVFNDAHAALRGFAMSNLNSSLVLSAGMNPSLYNYIAEFTDFLPDTYGKLKKKIILKVSDFRSAMVQGSFLAKKGVWVSEYRIESGLNCGGHAFATNGLLLGPILEEFKQRRQELSNETHKLLVKALQARNMNIPAQPMALRITAQGGVGTAGEHNFLLSEYNLDSVGWGSPFLLVPEATTTDAETRELLARAVENDLYRSNISPLGIPFNTVKGASNDYFKNKRIADNRPGSSCPKKLLALSTEFDDQGICTASRKYQKLKLQEINNNRGNTLPVITENTKKAVTDKACLCAGLANAAYINHKIKVKGEEQGIVICPGPNIAYFDKEVSLNNMIRHIYGYTCILAKGYRPHMFIKEMDLYIEYLVKEISDPCTEITKNSSKQWNTFKNNLLEGIAYYKNLFTTVVYNASHENDFTEMLSARKEVLKNIMIPQYTTVS